MRYNTITAVGVTLKSKPTVLYNFIPQYKTFQPTMPYYYNVEGFINKILKPKLNAVRVLLMHYWGRVCEILNTGFLKLYFLQQISNRQMLCLWIRAIR